MWTHDDAARLRRDAPAEADRRSLAERRDFIFSVRDLRDQAEPSWGGEFRVLVNQNLVLHFVPGLNEEMRDLSELPQFAVFPDDALAGEDRTHGYEGVKDLEAFEGVVFYVTREEYGRLRRELADAARRYGDWLRIPDALYEGSELVRLVAERVLEHSLVQAERRFDGSKRAF
jgi:hypothetical protein